VKAGENASMWSSNTPFSEKERVHFEYLLDRIYEAFLARVMEARKMTRDQALAVAEGRVWTGRQAKEKGLVDELGGLNKAVAVAKAAASISADQDVPVERFPRRKSTLELFVQLATEGVSVVPDIKISAGDILQALEAETRGSFLKAPEMRIK
jgi:protease IV